jgi:hypothetical protein
MARGASTSYGVFQWYTGRCLCVRLAFSIPRLHFDRVKMVKFFFVGPVGEPWK